MSVEIDAAHAGSVVLYITDRMDEACTILDVEAAEAAEATDIAQLRRTNGNQQIRYTNGGRFIFTSSRNQGHRGYSADIVSVSAHTHEQQNYMASVYPCMNAQARLIVRSTEPSTKTAPQTAGMVT